MRYQKRLTWFTAAYSQAAVIFPFFVAGPRFFSGAIQLGALMQISSAFGKVQDALSWFIESYSSLTYWKASVDRLLGFENACLASDRLAAKVKEEVVCTPGERVATDLELSLPNGSVLAKNVSLSLSAGQRALVTGRSGAGKSSLFRAVAGIWPYAKGSVSLPPERKTMFLPQKPYLPIGTLHDVLTYPGTALDVTREEIEKLLGQLDLKKFIPELDVTDDWSKRLSVGEQQRVAVARAVLHKPEWIFFDEATSGLDEASERAVFLVLREHLPNAALINVAHKEIAGMSYDTTITITPAAA